MKEFKADMEPSQMYRRANPVVMSKLDVQSVQNFNFPRITQTEVIDSFEGNKEHQEMLATE
jgi:hypothetical protein